MPHRHFNEFTKGQAQALGISAILLLILGALLYAFEISPRTANARYADILTGLCLAIFGSYVVGGTVEFATKAVDQGIKATGGMAMVLIVAWAWAPFYTSHAVIKWNKSLTLPADSSINFIIEHAKQERREGLSDIYFDFGSDEREIRNLRPKPIDIPLPYVGRNWAEVFSSIEKDLPCLTFSVNNNQIKFDLDKKIYKKRTLARLYLSANNSINIKNPTCS